MASYFVAVVAAFACLNAVAANPKGYPAYKAPASCPKPPLPDIDPVVFTQVAPAPFTYGPQAPAVIEHVAAPYEINYFGKPYVIKHKQSAALNVLTQTPVVIDEYAAPSVNEAAAPPAVIVEEVCPPVAAPAPVPAPIYAAPAPLPVPAYPAPAPCH